MGMRAKVVVGSVFAVFLLLGAGAVCADEAEVKETISRMISLLEGGKYQEMLEKFAEPDVIRKAKSEATFERLVEDFKGKPSERLLKCLKQAQSMTPVLNKEKAEAVFAETKDFTKEMKFRKIDDRWYLIDK